MKTRMIVIAAVVFLALTCFCLWAALSSMPALEEHTVLSTRTARPTYTAMPIATAGAPSAPTAEGRAAEPIATMKSVSTVKPTDTPLPIDTGTPGPTYTPRPTRIPRPTATRASEDIDVYRTGVMRCLELMSGGMGNIGTLFAEPRLTDDDWIVSIATAIAMVNAGYEALEGLVVPTGMQDTHGLVLWATKDCYDAMPYLVSGLDNLDADDLDTATLLMTSCTEKMGAATDLLP